MNSARSTVSDVSTDLQTHSNEQCRTQHTLSHAVAMALLLRLRQKSDYRTGALARGIAATAWRTFCDDRGELGGEGRLVQLASDEAAAHPVMERIRGEFCLEKSSQHQLDRSGGVGSRFRWA